jgi:hypothetical protein
MRGQRDPHPFRVGLPPTVRSLNVGAQKDNIGVPFAPYLYTVSTMHCMTVSLGLDGDGLGTVWGSQLATSMLTDAGFSEVAVREIESDPINYYYYYYYYYVARK